VSVVLFGDSLAYQAAPYFNLLVQAGGKAKVTDFAFGGTAACDWLPEMRRVARTGHPQAVVIEFAGNTFTSCMAGCAAESSSAVSRYCSDISTALRLFLAVGAHVFLEGTPITYQQWVTHDPHSDDLNRAFAVLAGKNPGRVTYVDAGKAVEGPDQSFAWTLPCLFFEPCVGPTVAGVRSNAVRNPDGVHFCPGQDTNSQGHVVGCQGYSSGAFRFAAAMAGPVIRALHLSRALTTRTGRRNSPTFGS
jgi:hypothetical protein